MKKVILRWVFVCSVFMACKQAENHCFMIKFLGRDWHGALEQRTYSNEINSRVGALIRCEQSKQQRQGRVIFMKSPYYLHAKTRRQINSDRVIHSE